jgi:transcriptional regulator with XRE-family HTH domain
MRKMSATKLNASESLVRQLQALRRAKGMSQAELGTLVGIPQSYISRLESRDVDLQLSTLIEIARALEMEVVLKPRHAPASADQEALRGGAEPQASRSNSEL